MQLQGKHVVFLGGFGGIGSKCIDAFLAKGIKHLAIFDLQENCAQMAAWRQRYGQQTHISFVPMNIIDKNNVTAAYQQAHAQMGHFDVVVNCCGMLNDQQIELTLQVNLLGTIYSTLTALDYMDRSRQGRGGLIINIASVVGLSPSLMFAIYSAAKAGVTTFTQSLAHPIVWQKTHVKFITICPAFTETTLFADFATKITFQDASMQCLCEKFKFVQMQSPAELAKCFIEAVEMAKNGSIWLIDMGIMSEINLPTIWVPKLKNEAQQANKLQ